MTLATDSMGSYALEAFLKSRFVPSEKKHVLIEKFKVIFTFLFHFSSLHCICDPPLENGH